MQFNIDKFLEAKEEKTRRKQEKARLKRDKKAKWQQWFAWRPVQVGREIIWLEKIYRSYDGWNWNYKTLMDFLAVEDLSSLSRAGSTAGSADVAAYYAPKIPLQTTISQVTLIRAKQRANAKLKTFIKK